MRLPLPELPGPGETKGRPRCHPLQWARLPTGVRREAPDWWITRVSNARNIYKIPEDLSIDFEPMIQSLPAITCSTTRSSNQTCPPDRGGHVREGIESEAQVHQPGGHQDLLAVVFVASTGCGLDATVFEGSATSRFRSTLPLATEPTFAFMASSMFSMACLEILSENS